MKKILKIQENKVEDMEIKNEIDILKKLDHPNIVKIFEFYIAKKIITSLQNFANMGNYIDILIKIILKDNYVFYFIKFFLVYVIYMKIILFIEILN